MRQGKGRADGCVKVKALLTLLVRVARVAGVGRGGAVPRKGRKTERERLLRLCLLE